MVIKLAHGDNIVANQIHAVFQRSYQVEAQLIKVKDFPPLARSINHIAQSKSDFYGLYLNHELAGVIEFEIVNTQLDIHSLTVDPAYFRQGIAGKLLHHVLSHFAISKAIVETAVANQAAINLYQKHGFVEYKRWTPTHGIEKLAMEKERCA